MSDEPSTGAPATSASGEAVPESEPKTVAYPRVRSALTLVKENPLKAAAIGAAALASLEVELAVGLLAGIGATALLARKSGADTREEVLARGKWALGRAKSALKRKEAPAPVVSAGDAPAAPPPA
jgi:hypothetical protein